LPEFEIKDTGARQEFESGMVRDIASGKLDWTLVADGPMLRRWAELLTNAAIVKGYGKRNWMKAAGTTEYERFRESAFRHFMSWYYGEKDEDHGAAVFFNINGAEYVGRKPSFVIADWLTNEPGEVGPPQPIKLEDCPRWDEVADDIPMSAKVGDVDANDILDVISTAGGAADLADDYNYLRNRVQQLSDQLNRGVVDEFE